MRACVGVICKGISQLADQYDEHRHASCKSRHLMHKRKQAAAKAAATTCAFTRHWSAINSTVPLFFFDAQGFCESPKWRETAPQPSKCKVETQILDDS